MTGVVGYQYFSDSEPEMSDVATANTKLFGAAPEVHCENAVACDTRAHDAYLKARKYVLQVGADPGNYYRATLEFQKAARFRELSGKQLADIGDVDARVSESKSRAEAEFYDARFRLSRAITNHDQHRCVVEAEYLAKLLPDDQHPYRVKLDAYRRTLSKGENR